MSALVSPANATGRAEANSVHGRTYLADVFRLQIPLGIPFLFGDGPQQQKDLGDDDFADGRLIRGGLGSGCGNRRRQRRASLAAAERIRTLRRGAGGRGHASGGGGREGVAATRGSSAARSPAAPSALGRTGRRGGGGEVGSCRERRGGLRGPRRRQQRGRAER
jgi:hypothetical protein